MHDDEQREAELLRIDVLHLGFERLRDVAVELQRLLRKRRNEVDHELGSSESYRRE